MRTADLSNLTIVEGDTGLIVFDPLICDTKEEAVLVLANAALSHSPGRQDRTPTRR